jgi:hypothetical protein
MSASRHRRWKTAPPHPRVLASAVIVATALLSTGAAVSTASAAPLSACTPTHGTIVVVDFAHWGGPIVRGCGVGQRTGYALLHAAGFTTAGDEHDGPAVVCRLGDAAFHHGTQYPTPDQDHCVQTPPTTGYWAYWVAPQGTNHWSYSLLGAMGEVPKPGQVELWIFGATNVAGTHGTGVPSFSPATVRAHPSARGHTSSTGTTQTSTSSSTASTTTHTTTMTRTTTHATSTPTTTATTTTHASTSAAVHTHRHPTHRRRPPHRPPHHSRRHRHSTTDSSPTTRAGATKVVSARPTTRRASSGSSTPLIIGGAIVLLLCAGAGRAIWLRRREE